jgi:hypothetical protein
MHDKCFSVLCQQANFELLESIPIRDTDVFRIVAPPDNSEKEPLLAPYGPQELRSIEA